jgi:hypothetical protein
MLVSEITEDNLIESIKEVLWGVPCWGETGIGREGDGG